jgi:hypothetical protein
MILLNELKHCINNDLEKDKLQTTNSSLDFITSQILAIYTSQSDAITLHQHHIELLRKEIDLVKREAHVVVGKSVPSSLPTLPQFGHVEPLVNPCNICSPLSNSFLDNIILPSQQQPQTEQNNKNNPNNNDQIVLSKDSLKSEVSQFIKMFDNDHKENIKLKYAEFEKHQNVISNWLYKNIIFVIDAMKQCKTDTDKNQLARLEIEKKENELTQLETDLILNQFAFNSQTWKDAELQRLRDKSVQEQNPKLDDLLPPVLNETRLKVLWEITNIKKKLAVHNPIQRFTDVPLLASLYPTGPLLPICQLFLKSEVESGNIPPLTDDLKLFFSALDVLNGKWIQFHGPGSLFKKDDPITSQLSLCNFHNKVPRASKSDHDRCKLNAEECKLQHIEINEPNYHATHSSPDQLVTSDFMIKIKWEY